jgi:uncharacterized protein (DUF58 family)
MHAHSVAKSATPGPSRGAHASTAGPGSAQALLQRLEWTVIRRLDGLLQGEYRTLWRGTGIDLADLREYQHGDDVRHIDWNVSARLQQPHVRQFTEDRELTAWFLVDLSASADFGSGERSKRAVAQEFVAVLARLLTRQGNRVGALLYGSEVDTVLPPGGGRRQVLELVQRMARRPPHRAAAVTDLGALLGAAQRLIRRRSTVFVLSDFFSAPGWETLLGRLALRHDVTAVRLMDLLEVDLPDLGLVTMQDAESGEQILVDTHDRGFRTRFAAVSAQREAALREALGRAGVDTLELSTQDDLLQALLRFTDLRRQRIRRGQARRAGRAQHVSANPGVPT